VLRPVPTDLRSAGANRALTGFGRVTCWKLSRYPLKKLPPKNISIGCWASDACAGVVQELQQRAIPNTNIRLGVRLDDDARHFLRLEVGRGRDACFLWLQSNYPAVVPCGISSHAQSSRSNRRFTTISRSAIPCFFVKWSKSSQFGQSCPRPVSSTVACPKSSRNDSRSKPD
jgi:hypothetical protein